MKATLKLFLLCIYCVTLYACNLIPSVDEESLPSTARVGVVSLMYDYMDYLNFSGIPIHSYQSSTHYVAKWNLNEFSVSATMKHLEDRFDVVNVSYSPTILKRGFNNTNFYTGLPIYYIHTVEEHYKKIVSTYDLDAIIVIVQNYTKPSLFQQAYSYGFLYKKIIKPRLKSFAAISLRIHDAESLNIIALEENVDAFVKVKGMPAYPSFYDYSTDEQNELKVWVEMAIDKAIVVAIKKMKLKPQEKSFFVF